MEGGVSSSLLLSVACPPRVPWLLKDVGGAQKTRADKNACAGAAAGRVNALVALGSAALASRERLSSLSQGMALIADAAPVTSKSNVSCASCALEPAGVAMVGFIG
jgi:hypothetical protein